VNYDRKHLENSKIGLENLSIFFLSKEWEPCCIWQNYSIRAYYMPKLQCKRNTD